MITTYSNAVSLEELESLNYWMNQKDHYCDDRPSAYSKIPSLEADDWPKEILKNILKKINIEHSLEQVFFFEQKITCFGLHADTGDGNQNNLGKNIIIPLNFTDEASTVIFKNKWLFSDVKFYSSDRTPNGDISKSTEFDISKEVTEDIYLKYLKHVERNKLKGLEIDTIYNWRLGDVFTFDRQYIHCTGYLTKPKRSIIILTRKNDSTSL